ncbi:hypothetical protein NIIg97_gp57 [Geobacillus phage vB_GthS_NIIg9.7]|nr:hypothetical protein NIIg97_gp57 [Geobacillus phage vB_GthS_NIIg9.7]
MIEMLIVFPFFILIIFLALLFSTMCIVFVLKCVPNWFKWTFGVVTALTTFYSVGWFILNLM